MSDVCAFEGCLGSSDGGPPISGLAFDPMTNEPMPVDLAVCSDHRRAITEPILKGLSSPNADEQFARLLSDSIGATPKIISGEM